MTLGEENIDFAEDMNCLPSFNIKQYGTLISRQSPKHLGLIQQSNIMFEHHGIKKCSCPLLGDSCLSVRKWLKCIDSGLEYNSKLLLYQNYLKGECSYADIIEEDLQRTFNENRVFHQKNVKEAISRILRAYTSYDKNVGYV